MPMTDRFLNALAARSGCLIPLALVLVVVAGGLAVRTGRPVARAELPAPGRIDPAGAIVSSTPISPEPAPPARGGLPATESTPAAESSPPPTPSPTPVPARPRLTATVDPRQWRGRALTEVIIREEPTTTARPAGLLLKDETAIVEATVPGEEVEKGNTTWFWVRSGAMAGFVYSTLFEAEPRPAR